MQSVNKFKLLSLISIFMSTLLTSSATYALPSDGRIDIWPNIPFSRGADLCRYSDSYGQTRTEYMREMVRNAQDLMMAGAYGNEALDMLVTFNSLYERNQDLAINHARFNTTPEASLKGYLDQYYRELRPRIKKLSFTHLNDLLSQVILAGQQRDTEVTQSEIDRIDYMAYGTYTLAPDCRGDLQVTLHLVGKNGESESFIARGKPSVVMSQIASELFTRYQRTQFPSRIQMGQQSLQLIGGMNGSVDRANSPQLAQQACRQLGGRLPNKFEIELLDSMGDWSGGVSFNNNIWAMPNGKVYAPMLRNPSPIRRPWEVNAKEFYYYCVK